MAEQKRLLELTGDRALALKVGDRVYRYTIRPVQEKDWLHYYDGVFSTSEREGRDVVRTLDADSAGVRLVESVLKNATGHNVAGAITAIENWTSKIPLAHRRTLAMLVASVDAIDDAGEQQFGFERVALQAVWNATEDGNNVRYSPLVHVFETPTAEQYRRYRRDASRSKIVGGSRTGKTVWLSASRTLIELYDELIDSVEGYSVNGTAIGAMSEDALRVMDASHKVAAATKLFSTADIDTPEASDEESEAE